MGTGSGARGVHHRIIRWAKGRTVSVSVKLLCNPTILTVIPIAIAHL
jgi:hypothetical protein